MVDTPSAVCAPPNAMERGFWISPRSYPCSGEVVARSACAVRPTRSPPATAAAATHRRIFDAGGSGRSRHLKQAREVRTGAEPTKPPGMWIIFGFLAPTAAGAARQE